MKQDEYSTARPDARATQVGPTKDRASSPSQLSWKLYAGAIIKSEDRPASVQIKRAAKLLTVIGLTTKHAVCGISDSFITNNYFLELIWKIIPANIFFLKFVH